jgi:hypothetical protein
LRLFFWEQPSALFERVPKSLNMPEHIDQRAICQQSLRLAQRAGFQEF